MSSLWDPLTLRRVQAELTVAMDWYTRCITGLRLTPVSTKSVDAAAVLLPELPAPPGRHRLAPGGGVARTRHPAHRDVRPRRDGGPMTGARVRRLSLTPWSLTTAKSISRII